MAQTYYKLVKAGKLSIDQVPKKYQELVRQMLGENQEEDYD